MRSFSNTVFKISKSYFGIICWKPCLYSCSNAGTTSCLRFQREASSFSKAGGGGSLHSGKKTMKDKGSKVSSNSFSKWTMVASMSSSQNGGLASNEPQWGRNSRMGLKDKQHFSFSQKKPQHFQLFLTLGIQNRNQYREKQNNTVESSYWAVNRSTQRLLQSSCEDIPERPRALQLGFVHLRPQTLQKSLGNVSAASRHASENGQTFGHQHSHNGTIAPEKPDDFQ